jgi:hypothetical protein
MLVVGSLLFHFLAVQALRVPNAPFRPLGQRIMDSFAWSSVELASYCVRMFVTYLPLAASWTALVVLPVFLMTRRHVVPVPYQRVSSYAIVVAITATAALIHQTVVGNIGESIGSSVALGFGGAIGLVAVGIADLLLPPNKSLERTREG